MGGLFVGRRRWVRASPTTSPRTRSTPTIRTGRPTTWHELSPVNGPTNPGHADSATPGCCHWRGLRWRRSATAAAPVGTTARTRPASARPTDLPHHQPHPGRVHSRRCRLCTPRRRWQPTIIDVRVSAGDSGRFRRQTGGIRRNISERLVQPPGIPAPPQRREMVRSPAIANFAAGPVPQPGRHPARDRHGRDRGTPEGEHRQPDVHAPPAPTPAGPPRTHHLRRVQPGTLSWPQGTRLAESDCGTSEFQESHGPSWTRDDPHSAWDSRLRIRPRPAACARAGSVRSASPRERVALPEPRWRRGPCRCRLAGSPAGRNRRRDSSTA